MINADAGPGNPVLVLQNYYCTHSFTGAMPRSRTTVRANSELGRCFLAKGIWPRLKLKAGRWYQKPASHARGCLTNARTLLAPGLARRAVKRLLRSFSLSRVLIGTVPIGLSLRRIPVSDGTIGLGLGIGSVEFVGVFLLARAIGRRGPIVHIRVL
jgi:hypothetical protein